MTSRKVTELALINRIKELEAELRETAMRPLRSRRNKTPGSLPATHPSFIAAWQTV
ncbi:uncharacterized protein FFFS_08531 [Fusarium fujikuroi]|nr:uncharacterized protein FFFS_08531 [Fusarium fujikuroi]